MDFSKGTIHISSVGTKEGEMNDICVGLMLVGGGCDGHSDDE